MELNDSIQGPDPAYPDALSVVVTGGNAETRLAVKNVIFNALEGEGFRETWYSKEDVPVNLSSDGGPFLMTEPVENAGSLLSLCEALNPLLFFTPITIESHQSLTERGRNPQEVRDGRWPEDQLADNNLAWERAQKPAANDTIKEVVIEGTVRLKY